MLKFACILLAAAAAWPLAAAERIDIGLSSHGAVIQGARVPAGSANAPTVLIIGGLKGHDGSTKALRRVLRAYESRKPSQRRFRLLAVPLVNPDASPLQFPPTGVAYRENPEANALWRWIGIQAPDLVLVAAEKDFGLAQALSENAVAEVGRIPARRVAARRGILDWLRKDIPPSDAHREMNRRLARTPRQLAEELAQYYGHDFAQPLYIQAIALIARVRLGAIEDVQRLVEPYVNGTKDALARPNSLVLAGQLVFAELARRTGDMRYVQMVRRAADLGFEPDGTMKASMPFHEEYSDSIFMGTVIAAEAGALTGERKYFDLAARHVAFMQKIVLRPDGLYRHQPLTDAAWGRGNAFPAIGLALALSRFPKDHPDYPRLLDAFRAHMRVLARYQTPDGLWRNVIDYPGAYREFTATAMIGFAMLRGIRNGWLAPAEFQPRVDAAWHAILARVGPHGHIVDGCESTMKMKSLEDYLHRAAILGADARSGAMAMLFATELAGL